MTLFLFFVKILLSGLTILMSTWMPDDSDTQGLKDNEFWRVYLGFPIFLCIFAILGIKFFIKYETPKYLLTIGNE